MSSLDVTFTSLSQLSRAYGAPAVDMAGRVLQDSARGQLVGGAILMIASCGFGLWAAKTFSRGTKADKYDKFDWGMGGGAITLVAIILGGISFSLLSDVWAWTALTDPQLALAHKIFDSMGG